MQIEKTFKTILDCCFKIHTELGPGLLENAYEHCLFHEITSSGLSVYQQKPIPLVYKKVKLETGYRADLYVENQIVIEVKSIEALADIHLAQVLTYMRLSESKLGLLVNFNVLHLRDGIKRVIL
jgi:GxxExxY protein